MTNLVFKLILKNDVDRVGDISNRKLILFLGGKHDYSTYSLWKFQWHFKINFSTIDQFRYIKIQPKTIDFNTRLLGINPTNSVVIPMSLVLRSIVFGWILIYRNWSIISLAVLKFSKTTRCALQFQNSEQICMRLIDQEITRLLRMMILMQKPCKTIVIDFLFTLLSGR